MPNLVRNYKQEMKTATARGDDKNRAMRNKARRHATAAGKVSKRDGKDVDHRVPLRSGGSASDSNTRIRSSSSNKADNGASKKKRN